MTSSIRLVNLASEKKGTHRRCSQKALIDVANLGSKDAEKKRLVAKLSELDANYPGGLPEYIRNSKKLLKDAQDGEISNLTGYAGRFVCTKSSSPHVIYITCSCILCQ